MSPRDGDLDGAPALRALTELSDADLAATLGNLGGKPFQARQVLHWVWKHGVESFDQMHNVPVHLRALLAAGHGIRSTAVVKTDVSEDGTEKLLLRLHDGESVECVIIPDGERTTLCISTQVGCPVGCVFCASGMFGVRRNLSVGEIAEQVLVARSRLREPRRLTNLVVMGMGEPMLNLDALLPALQRIHDPAGIDMGARRITVSTSGYPRQMERFAAADPSYNLAVSLHAADDALRRRLVPTATHPVREIVTAAHRYFGHKGREVTYEVVLLEGVNDRPVDALALVETLSTLPCTVNLIPWNPVEEIARHASLRRPAPHRVDAFADALRRGGVNVTVRRQRGADRSAACGQLRLREAHY
ncbi:MAG TPA: 23S rRNA (adenine(2503)-C(2))-methyltransferase RlmN [Planctomycetota bacterium]|nr:23S rRNA (adenine(2503)-C(2))-methyltransferase RlmN [Planctomycetota bacterium]